MSLLNFEKTAQSAIFLVLTLANVFFLGSLDCLFLFVSTLFFVRAFPLSLRFVFICAYSAAIRLLFLWHLSRLFAAFRSRRKNGTRATGEQRACTRAREFGAFNANSTRSSVLSRYDRDLQRVEDSLPDTLDWRTNNGQNFLEPVCSTLESTSERFSGNLTK